MLGSAGNGGSQSRGGALAAGSAQPPSPRQSNGLDQFFHSLRDMMGLSILDLGGASQANISFITSLGHRIYSEDFLRTMEQIFGSEFYENQTDGSRVESFLQQTLSFPDGHFDGALVWDAFQFMSPSLLQPAIEQLARVLRPNAYLLSFFHSDERATSVPVYSYRIADPKTLQLSLRGYREPAQFFNNRALERLFQNFQSVKFFLARDHLREVIVKR
jgi:SAM-dependent methyltransferase